MRLPAPLDVRLWHPRAEVVYLEGDLPEETLRELIAYAEFEGWIYNPITRTFVKP